MGTIKIGSSNNRKGITINPSTVIFNGNNVEKIMKNTTTIWENIKALIPTMTSNSAPSGNASGSSIITRDFDYYKAFDKKDTTFWCAGGGGTTNQYLKYKFDNAVCVKKVVLKNHSDASRLASPKNFRIEASNDNTNWDIIGTFLNTNNDAFAEMEFALSNSTYYLYYRIYVNDRNGSYNAITIGELQYYGKQ